MIEEINPEDLVVDLDDEKKIEPEKKSNKRSKSNDSKKDIL